MNTNASERKALVRTARKWYKGITFDIFFIVNKFIFIYFYMEILIYM
jgi:hypothetical protein